MTKMTEELAQCFDTQHIRLLDAKTGDLIETFDGRKSSERYLLGHGYHGHTIYCINPGTEIHEGTTIEILQIWIEA